MTIHPEYRRTRLPEPRSDMPRSGPLFVLPPDGSSSTDVRTSRHGDWPWPGKRNPDSLFPLGIVVSLFARRNRERLQYRRRSRRHGRSDSDDHGDTRLFPGTVFCSRDPGPIAVDLLPNHGAIFKWLTVVLFAYIITAFLVHPDWTAVMRATFVPHIEFSKQYMAVLVGILGTTISPYLFFWQAAQEVEEDRDRGKTTVAKRRGATNKELSSARRDVITGMFLSNTVMYFLILTTAATLNAHGLKDIETAKQAAEALRPLAGRGAYLLFTLGLIGTGMLAVPVLAGSCAYVIAEAAKWRSASLNLEPKLAGKF